MPPFIRSLRRRAPGWLSANVALALLCAVVIGLLWVLTFERVTFERAQTIEDQISNNDNLALAFDEHTTLSLKVIDNNLRLIRHEYGGNSRPNIAALIKSGMIDASNYAFVGITDERGDVILGSEDFTPVNLADREFFKVHQQHDNFGMFVGKPLLGRLTGRWVISFSRRINKPDGSFGGVVFVGLHPGYFTSFYEKARLGEQGMAQLVGLDGIGRARRVGSVNSFGQDMSKSTLIAELAKGRSGHYYSAGRLEGVRRLSSYRVLSDYPLAVAVGAAEVEVLKEFHARERNYYLSAAAVTAILLIFVAGFIATSARQKRAEFLLAGSEQRFRSMIENASDLVVLIDVRGMILFASSSVKGVIGHEVGEVLGKSLLFFMHPDDAPAWLAELSEAVRNPNALIKSERRFLHKNGTWLTLESIARNALDDPQLKGIIINARDVTERKRTEVRRELAERELAENEEKFRGLIEQTIAGVYIIQNERFAYVNPRFAEIVGYETQELIGKEVVQIVDEPYRALVLVNIQKRLRGEIKNMQYTLVVRRKDGRLVDIGVHGSSAMFQGKRALIGIMQDITERKKSEEQERHYLEQLELSMVGTLNAVSTMVEIRDPYTSGHERRVGDIAAAIGAEMGLPQEQIKGLRIIGNVHDIGKIAIPAEILSKPGQLSAIEFEIIKAHAQQGHDILKDIDFPWPVAQTILQHHERLDGSGYPQGLKGEAILLDARIMAVADVVEAMSSHRPYRPGLGINAALNEIEERSGQLYDPQVAATCLRLFREKNYRIPA